VSRSATDVGPVWGESARRYISACDYAENAEYLLFVQELAVRSNLRRASVVLDVGSGPGTLCSLLKCEHPTTLVIGIDASPEMIRHSSRTYGDVRFVQGDAHALPLESDSVDHLVSLNALHHLTSLDTVIREFLRVLRPGAFAYLGDLRRDAPENEVSAKLGRMHPGIREDFLLSLDCAFELGEVMEAVQLAGARECAVRPAGRFIHDLSRVPLDPLHHELDLSLSFRATFRKPMATAHTCASND
jgi:ubiquinone/menaquinone biosynthesis C-methylase UbiE